MSFPPRLGRHQRRLRQLGGLLIAVALLLELAWPSYAQFPSLEEAPIVIDGRPLFEITSTDQVSAEERSEKINRELKDRVTADADIDITWEIRKDSPVILVNDRYLMTVTQSDTALGGAEDVRAQAAAWAGQLDEALNTAQDERTQAVLQEKGLLALAVLLLVAGVDYLSAVVWRRSLRPALEHLASPQEEGNVLPAGLNLLLTLLLAMFRCGLWFGAATYITNLFPFTRRWSYFLRRQALVGFLEPKLRLGQNEFSILNLIILLGLLLGIVVLSGVFANFLRSRILRLTGMNRGTREAVSIFVKYTLIFVGVVVLLQIWGLDLSSLALIASALGVGIGLGLQNIAKDFGSGLIMVFERPILVGDFVELDQFQGTVEHIGARSTEIRTLDQISIIVPNSRFLEHEVINWSHRNPISRIRLPVGVAYHSDPEQVRTTLIEVGHSHEHVLSKPPPLVFFTGFGDSALEFELLVWIANPTRQLSIKSDLYFSIEAALRRQGIEIPFPQRDLHIRSGQLPVEFSAAAPKLIQPQLETGKPSSSQGGNYGDRVPRSSQSEKF